jgi:hypothetical protein
MKGFSCSGGLKTKGYLLEIKENGVLQIVKLNNCMDLVQNIVINIRQLGINSIYKS